MESEPLNSSDDLFEPPVRRDAFIPKPLEKLSLASFRYGFERLRTIHEEAYRIWREYISPRYSSLKTAERRAAVNITNKLASISLLSDHVSLKFSYFFDK